MQESNLDNVELLHWKEVYLNFVAVLLYLVIWLYGYTDNNILKYRILVSDIRKDAYQLLRHWSFLQTKYKLYFLCKICIISDVILIFTLMVTEQKKCIFCNYFLNMERIESIFCFHLKSSQLIIARLYSYLKKNAFTSSLKWSLFFIFSIKLVITIR